MYEKQDVEALERQFNAAMEEADTGAALEAISALYDEFDRGEAERLAAVLHPELEVQMKTIFLEGKIYKGVRGFINWRKDMEELFEEQRFQPVGVRFAGNDRWVVLGRLHMKEAESGVELDVPLAHAFEKRDKKVARFTSTPTSPRRSSRFGLYA